MVAWAHGTTGFAQPCAPSLLPEPFTAGAMPALDEVLDRGWILVATDYVGLGTAGPHPYLIGQGEGRSVLDAMKAAHQLRTVDLDLSPTSFLSMHLEDPAIRKSYQWEPESGGQNGAFISRYHVVVQAAGPNEGL